MFSRQVLVLLELCFISVTVLGMPFGETACSFLCNANFHPVCGELPNGDFKAYPNACELDRALCYGDAASDAADIKCDIEREELVFSYDGVFSGFDDGTSI